MLTVKTLREWLDKQEAAWTKDDDKFLGTFDSQAILVDYWQRKEEGAEIEYTGLGPSKIEPYYELGILVIPSEYNALSKE